MKRISRVFEAVLCSLLMVLFVFGTINAKAEELPKLKDPLKPCVVEYGENAGALSAITVKIPTNAKLIKYEEQYNATVCAQVDWKFSKDDEWKYNSCWDSLKPAVEGSRWEKYYEYVENPEYSDFGNVYLFEFENQNDDWSWGGETGWSRVVPKSYLKTIDFENETLTTIDWNKVGIDVRYRYYIGKEIYNEETEEYEMLWEASDWSDTVSYGNFSKDYDGIGNLLVNPDFEDGLKGWKDPDKAWSVEFTSDTGKPKHGNFLTWPYISGSLEKNTTRIYQDVSLEGYNPDDTVIFNTLICNYDQPPHDMGKVTLAFLDKDGKAINTYSQSQRNPNWNSQSIVCSIPKGAEKVRVSLWAYRYVGSDIDAYYDYCSLVVKRIKVYPVIVTEKNNKSKAKKGDKIQLVADNSKTKDASAYSWSSSYNTAATVDDKGLVTMHTDGEDGFAIYAKDKESGVTGVYWINSDEETNASSISDSSTISEKDVSDKPAAASISKLTASSKAFKASWKKVSGVKGYELRYSTSKTMKSAKTVSISKASTVSKTVKKLKSKKTYYVQIRTYKVVNGKKLYSDWSKAAAIKVK